MVFKQYFAGQGIQQGRSEDGAWVSICCGLDWHLLWPPHLFWPGGAGEDASRSLPDDIAKGMQQRAHGMLPGNTHTLCCDAHLHCVSQVTHQEREVIALGAATR